MSTSHIQWHDIGIASGSGSDTAPAPPRDHVIELSAAETGSSTPESGLVELMKPVASSVPWKAQHPDAHTDTDTDTLPLPLPLPSTPPLVPAGAGASTRDLNSAKATTMAISAFKTPKNNLLLIIKAGLAKAQLSVLHIFLLGMMAGMYVSCGALVMTIITGGLSGDQVWSTSSTSTSVDPVTNAVTSTTLASTTHYTLPAGFQRLIQAAVFPLALIPVILAGAELFTSNVMFGLAAWYGRKTTTNQMLRHWGLSYLGNFVGSVLFAYFLVYLTELTNANPIHSWLHNMAMSKTHQGWGIMVLKGVGCNILVCLAVWHALVAEDVAGKILGIWWPIFGFVAIGFEHSIANMFLVPLALMTGVNINFGDFLAWNLIPVTLGNLIGGGLFITIQWLVFREHLQQQLVPLTVKAGYKVPSLHVPATLAHAWHTLALNTYKRNNTLAKDHDQAQAQAQAQAQSAVAQPMATTMTCTPHHKFP